MNFTKHPLMALGLCTALGAAACGDNGDGNDGTGNGNGNGVFDDMGNGNGNGNGDPDMGFEDIGNGNGNGDPDMGFDMGVEEDMGVVEDMGPPVCVELALTPAMDTLEEGETLSLEATCTFSNSTTDVVTDGLSFSAAPMGVVTISNAGVVTAVSVGMTTVTVQFTNARDETLSDTSEITVEVDPCPAGTEGCPCPAPATAGPDDTMLSNDLCDPGLVCAPLGAYYDDLNPANEEPFPLFLEEADTCLQECTVDADCGNGRFCNQNLVGGSPFLLGGERGFCVDEVNTFEEACSISKELNPIIEIDTDGDQLSDTALQQELPGQLVGCDTGLTCTVNIFNGLNPNEGICLPFCTEDAECTSFAGDGRDQCNFVFADGVGICNDQRIGLGDIAGRPSTVAGPDALLTTFQNGCSVPLAGLSLGGTAICFEPCDTMNACSRSTGPDDAMRCVQPNPNANGFCSSDCSDRDGINDTLCPLDRTCLPVNINFQDNPMGMDIVGQVDVCRSSIQPNWDPVEVTDLGQVDTGTGESCFPTMTQADLFTCAPKSQCFDVGGAGNQTLRCVTFCDFVENSTTSDGYCEDLNGVGSVCTDQTQLDPGVGFCSTP